MIPKRDHLKCEFAGLAKECAKRKELEVDWSHQRRSVVRHKPMAAALRTLRLLSWAVQYIWHIDTECHNNILNKNESVFGSPNIYYSFVALHTAVPVRGE